MIELPSRRRRGLLNFKKRKTNLSSRDPQKLGEVLADLLARRGYAQLAIREEFDQAWSKVVGNLAKFSRPTEVKRGVLNVMVSNSVVMQELTLRKADLVAAIATELPDHNINDLRFRVGTLN